MIKIKNIGYFISLLFGISLFLSQKFQNNVALPLITLLFIISILFGVNRKNFFKLLDKKIATGTIVFSILPTLIAIIDGGIKSRIDNYNLK